MSAECTDTWHKLHHAEAINEGVALPGQHMADLVLLRVGLGRHWLCNAWTWLAEKKNLCQAVVLKHEFMTQCKHSGGTTK